MLDCHFIKTLSDEPRGTNEYGTPVRLAFSTTSMIRAIIRVQQTWVQLQALLFWQGDTKDLLKEKDETSPDPILLGPLGSDNISILSTAREGTKDD